MNNIDFDDDDNKKYNFYFQEYDDTNQDILNLFENDSELSNKNNQYIFSFLENYSETPDNDLINLDKHEINNNSEDKELTLEKFIPINSIKTDDNNFLETNLKLNIFPPPTRPYYLFNNTPPPPPSENNPNYPVYQRNNLRQGNVNTRTMPYYNIPPPMPNYLFNNIPPPSENKPNYSVYQRNNLRQGYVNTRTMPYYNTPSPHSENKPNYSVCKEKHQEENKLKISTSRMEQLVIERELSKKSVADSPQSIKILFKPNRKRGCQFSEDLPSSITSRPYWYRMAVVVPLAINPIKIKLFLVEVEEKMKNRKLCKKDIGFIKNGINFKETEMSLPIQKLFRNDLRIGNKIIWILFQFKNSGLYLVEHLGNKIKLCVEDELTNTILFEKYFEDNICRKRKIIENDFWDECIDIEERKKRKRDANCKSDDEYHPPKRIKY